MYLLNYILELADRGIFVTIETIREPDEELHGQIGVRIEKVSNVRPSHIAGFILTRTMLRQSNFDWETTLIDRIKRFVRDMDDVKEENE